MRESKINGCVATYTSGGASPSPTREPKSKVTDKGEIILNVITVIGIALFVWGFLSYIDIISHNLTTQEYSPFNMWEIILKFIIRN